jgi:hypothetical protein
MSFASVIGVDGRCGVRHIDDPGDDSHHVSFLQLPKQEKR